MHLNTCTICAIDAFFSAAFFFCRLVCMNPKDTPLNPGQKFGDPCPRSILQSPAYCDKNGGGFLYKTFAHDGDRGPYILNNQNCKTLQRFHPFLTLIKSQIYKKKKRLSLKTVLGFSSLLYIIIIYKYTLLNFYIVF